MQAVAIAAILITWALFAFICVGLGAWLPRALKSNAPIDLPAYFLAGLITLLAILQLWHFFAPINFSAHITLIILGIIGSRAVPKSTLQSVVSTPRYALLLFLLIAIWLANRATGPNAEYDAGLYHIPAVNWTESFRIVPGLANLHMRFGFSSTLTLFSAFLDQGFWQGDGSHFLNGFFLATLAAMIIRSGAKIVTRSTTTPAADWLLLFTAPLLTDWALDIQASSYSTDIGAAVLTILAAYYFFRAETDRETSPFLTILLAAAAISAKASTLLFCLPLILIVWLLQKPRRPAGLIAAALLILPWLIRQTILSGYPLYPSESVSLPVDWKVPYAKVEWLHQIMRNWARWMSYDYPSGALSWIRPYLHLRLLTVPNLWKCLIPAILGIVALIAATFLGRWSRRPFLLLLCLYAAGTAWFSTVPDPRYASQIFILAMALGFMLIAHNRSFVILAAALAVTPLLFGRNAWIPPAPHGLFHPTPTSSLTTTTTSTGLQIYVPLAEPGKFEDRVWNAPLPNAPQSEIDPVEVKIPELRLRHPPDLQGGFFRSASPP